VTVESVGKLARILFLYQIGGYNARTSPNTRGRVDVEANTD